MLCRICAVQIQPRKHVLDHADHTAPTRQHELDHTDHTDYTDQECICPERSRSCSRNISYRSSVRCVEVCVRWIRCHIFQQNYCFCDEGLGGTYVYMYTCDSPTFFSCLVFDGGTRRCHLSPVDEVLQVVYMRMSFSCRVCCFSCPLMNPLGCNL